MVRSAQDFSLLIPIIEGMGNFGSLDMPPAASRYTEAKVSSFGWTLVKGLEDKIVPMMPNYDGTTEEPVFLPVPFPYLLVNGTSGIGVGMASSIPSHNLANVIDMTTYFIWHPNATIDKLVEKLKGPDFNSGCEVVNKEEFAAIYEEGRGSFKMRAKFTVTGSQIKATNLPYHVSGSHILEQLNEAQSRGEATFIKEVIDMSGQEEMVLINIATKDIDMAIRELCRLSDLEKNFPLDLSVVTDSPKRVNLIDFLRDWVDTHKKLNIKKIEQDKANAEARLHILDGLLRAVAMMDTVIKAIRESEDRANAKNRLIDLGFTILQSDAILDMRLVRLTKLSEVTLIKEANELKELVNSLNALLTDEALFSQYLIDKMEGYKSLANPRRSLITQNVFAKVVKEVDSRFSINFVKTKNKVIVSEGSSSSGINGDSGSPVYIFCENNVIPIKDAKETTYFNVLDVLPTTANSILHISEDGYIKKTRFSDVKVSRKAIIAKQDKVVGVLFEEDSKSNYVLLTLNDGKRVQFTVEDINSTGRNTRGVIAVKLAQNQKVVKAELGKRLPGIVTGRNKTAK